FELVETLQLRRIGLRRADEPQLAFFFQLALAAAHRIAELRCGVLEDRLQRRDLSGQRDVGAGPHLPLSGQMALLPPTTYQPSLRPPLPTQPYPDPLPSAPLSQPFPDGPPRRRNVLPRAMRQIEATRVHVRRTAQHSDRQSVKERPPLDERQQCAQTSIHTRRNDQQSLLRRKGAHIRFDPLRAEEWLIAGPFGA